MKKILFGVILGLGLLGASSCSKHKDLVIAPYIGTWQLDSLQHTNGTLTDIFSYNYTWDISENNLTQDWDQPGYSHEHYTYPITSSDINGFTISDNAGSSLKYDLISNTHNRLVLKIVASSDTGLYYFRSI